MAFERIAIDHEIMGGVPCISGTRIPVTTVVAMIAEGMTTADVWTSSPAHRGRPPRRMRLPPPLLTSTSCRFALLNEVLGRRVAFVARRGGLAEAGHEAIHVGDLKLLGAADLRVMEAAASTDRVLFLRTRTSESCSPLGVTRPSVIILRRVSHRPEVQTELLLANLDGMEESLAAGAVVVPIGSARPFQVAADQSRGVTIRGGRGSRAATSSARPSRGRRHRGVRQRVEDALTRLSHGSLEKS